MHGGAIDRETSRPAVLLGSGERRRRPYLEQEEQERMEWRWATAWWMGRWLVLLLPGLA